MIVKIQVIKAEYYDSIRDEYEYDFKYVEVEIPNDKLYELVGEHYGIDAKLIGHFISDFDIEDIIADRLWDEIEELAYAIYREDYDE